MDPSRLRQKIRTLCPQIDAQIQIALDRSPLFAASLYEHKIKCGKPQCKCATIPSYRHHMWCVSFADQGRSRTRVVPQSDRPAVQDLTQAYRRFRQARRKIKDLSQQLLQAVDALGQARCQDGHKRYTRLASRSESKPSNRRTEKGPPRS